MRLPFGVFARGSVFWCRVVVPKDLRHLYPRTESGALRTTHSNVSLQTSDRAEARVRGLSRRAEVEGEFLLKRKALSPAAVVPTRAMVAMLADRILHRILADDDKRRLSGDPIKGFPLQGPAGDIPEDPMERMAYLAALEEGYHTAMGLTVGAGKTFYGRELANVEAKSLGLVLDWTGQDVALLRLSRAGVQAHIQAAKRTQGAPVDTPHLPEIPEGLLLPVAAPLYLRDVLENWKAKRRPSDNAIGKTDRALLLLKESGMDKPMDKLARPDGARLRDWFRDPQRGFKQKTGQNYWLALQALWNVATEYGQAERNPWAGMVFEVSDSKPRAEFTQEQLQTLFGSTLYTKGTYRAAFKVQAWDAYFMTLLGLWTGARIGEIAQLEVVDVLTENGIFVLAIHEEAEGSTIKTEESIRRIPVPPDVLRLGFMSYVQDRKTDGQVKLFPSLHRGGKTSPGDVMGEWFRAYRMDLELPSGPLNGFHKFRHTIRSALAAHHVGPETADALTGHTTQGSAGRMIYTHVRPATVLAALSLPLFPSLSLERFYPEAAA